MAAPGDSFPVWLEETSRTTVSRSRPQCGDVTSTWSTCWEQTEQETLELAKEPSLTLEVSRREGKSLEHGDSIASMCPSYVLGPIGSRICCACSRTRKCQGTPAPA